MGGRGQVPGIGWTPPFFTLPRVSKLRALAAFARLVRSLPLTSARFLRLVVAGNCGQPAHLHRPVRGFLLVRVQLREAAEVAGQRVSSLLHGEPGPRAGWMEGGGRRSGLVPRPLPHACPPLSPCPSLCLCRQAQAHRLTLRGPGVTEAVLQTTGPCPAPGHARRFWAAR